MKSLDSSKRNPFLPVETGKNVQFLIDNFLKYGVHRVPVIAGGFHELWSKL